MRRYSPWVAALDLDLGLARGSSDTSVSLESTSTIGARTARCEHAAWAPRPGSATLPSDVHFRLGNLHHDFGSGSADRCRSRFADPRRAPSGHSREADHAPLPVRRAARRGDAYFLICIAGAVIRSMMNLGQEAATEDDRQDSGRPDRARSGHPGVPGPLPDPGRKNSNDGVPMGIRTPVAAVKGLAFCLSAPSFVSKYIK